MRIISGKAKGLRLSTPPGKGMSIRPTSDRSREALFSILGEKVTGARVLDLYAGTGALGLEALSRGAVAAVFADKSKTSLGIIRRNIEIFNTCLDGKTDLSFSVIKADLKNGLQPLSRVYSGDTGSFDIIFLDPPYGKNLAQRTLEHLDKSKLPAENGLIVAEERANIILSAEFHNIRLLDRRRYGDTGFWIYGAA